METKYTTSADQVVFLKDTDLVKNIQGENFADSIISTNPVASFDLVSSLSDTAELCITSAALSISTNAENLGLLSTKVDENIEYNLDTARFRGTVDLKEDVYDYPFDSNVQVSPGEELYGLLLTDLRNTASMAVPKGWMFKTKADDATKSYKVNGEYLHANEYIILNHEVAPLSDIELSDVSIIKDYDVSVATLLSSDSFVSAILTAIDSSISTDLTSLSSSFKTISGDFDERITSCKNGISYLSG